MRVAVIGAGLIGRSWAMVFARGGAEVTLWDQDAHQPTRALDSIAVSLREMQAAGLIDEASAVLSRIHPRASLAHAVDGAGFVQESIAERPEPKQALFAEIERLAKADCILASSTSAILPSILFGNLASRHRCLVTHPMNPPHLAPIVEICGGDFTAPSAVAATTDLMRGCGMVPIVVNKEIDGFILNRLQLAVLNEAFRLISRGYVSAADLDKTVKDGLALRWAFMGPVETIDLNAPGGVADYMTRYGPTIRRIGLAQAAEPDWPDSVVAALDATCREHVPQEGLDAHQAWRDRRMTALIAHKKMQEKL